MASPTSLDSLAADRVRSVWKYKLILRQRFENGTASGVRVRVRMRMRMRMWVMMRVRVSIKVGRFNIRVDSTVSFDDTNSLS